MADKGPAFVTYQLFIHITINYREIGRYTIPYCSLRICLIVSKTLNRQLSVVRLCVQCNCFYDKQSPRWCIG